MSVLTDLLLLPFGLVLEIVSMVLWIVSSICEATFSLLWDLAWYSMSLLEFILELALTIVGHALFEWLPMLIRFLYRAILYTAPIAWRCVEVIFRILSSAWMFVYHLPWRESFVKIFSTVWDWTSSAALLFHQQGSYTVKEVSKINYGAIWKHLSETYIIILTAIFIGTVTCVLALIWQNQEKNRSRRENSEAENRERQLQLQRRRGEPAIARRQRSRSRSQSSSAQDSDENAAGSSTSDRVPITANDKSSSAIDDAVQESTDSVESVTELLAPDTELLRRQLHLANEELSQERDKFLCVVCQDLKREVILKPCNHYCLCHECSRALRECPICKRRVRNTEIIYHA